MFNLWQQASQKLASTNGTAHETATSETTKRREGAGDLTSDPEQPSKRRKMSHMPIPAYSIGELPRPKVTSEEAYERLSQGNVIAVVQSQEEKLKVLRSLIGRSIVEQKSSKATNDGTQGHRFVLFVVDDNYSLAEYATELENDDFTVGSYTVALHSSNSNEWPSVVYNDIVVVAANLLLDSLSDGNVKLSQAHLIVISDAQRVMPMQIPHPVLRMMTDFYAKILEPPRVLAAVTSDLDRWASLDLSRLEIAFRAQSLFITTGAVATWPGPLELVVEYEPATLYDLDPAISAKLRESDPEGLLLRSRHFRKARCALQQLGPYGSNLFWRNLLYELALLPTSETSTSKDEAALSTVLGRLVHTRKGWAEETLVPHLGSPGCNITPKLAKVLEVLSIYEEYGSNFRGIIVVKDSVVAQCLGELLQKPQTGLPFIRATEVRPNAVSDSNYQKQLYEAFSKGEQNLLILTRSSRDLELPPVSTVISFDLFADHLSYAYNHAHSKGRNSHQIYLVEKGNNEQRRILSHVQTMDAELRTWIAGFTQGTSQGFPPKSFQTSMDPCLSDSDEESTKEEFILDPTTSARLHRCDAEAALYRFIADFEAQSTWAQGPASISVEQHPPEGIPESYRCTIALPKGTGVPDVVGPHCPTKAQARRETFYLASQVCVLMGLMDYRHFPQPEWRPTDLSSAADEKDSPKEVKTATASSSTHGYPRKSPDFWANSSQYQVTVLYPTVVVPDPLAGEAHAPVVLLTRAPLPGIPDFPVFYSGARANVRFYKGLPFEVTSAQLQALRGYTVRATRSLTNKPFDCAPEDLLCFFAPLRASWQPLAGTQGARWSQAPVGEHIPWDAVQLAADYFAVPLYSNLTALDDNARDAVVQDRNVEFTMRHFLVKVRHDMTPFSKAEDSPREAGFANFIEYCKARRKDFAGIEDEKQPMVEVTAIPGVINNLHPMSAPPTPPARVPLKYLIPELTYKFTIPASTFRTLWLLPSIMTKLDSHLLVKELSAQLFRLQIAEPHLLVALSTRAAWTDANYERLEFLGDAFLKVLASNLAYAAHPAAGEGALHRARQDVIGNKALHGGATRVGVPPYVQHKRFVAKLWQPPHLPHAADDDDADGDGDGDGDVEMGGQDAYGDVEMDGQDAYGGAGVGKGGGKGNAKGKARRTKKQRQLDAQNTLWMGDKVVADVVEAILAAAFLSGGHDAALQAARRLEIPLPNVAQWTDFGRIGGQQAAQEHAPSVPPLPPSTVEAVQLIVGSVFSKPELLAQALTHGSVLGGAEGASYERLEFIGDAILDFLVARHIFERHAHLSPGGLTLLKGAMVSNRALAAFCVQTGLHAHLRTASEQLRAAVDRYVRTLDELRRKEYDAAAREKRLPGQYWLDMPMEPPKCLSDVVESVVGALYVSDGFFEVGVGRFFETVFKPFMDAHVRLQTLSTNPKVTLLELLQAEGCQQHGVVKKPQERQNGPVEMEVHVHGKVIASATDSSATIATRRVSLTALDALANDPELLARICDCGSGEARKQAPKAEGMTQEEAEAAEVEGVMDAVDDEE